MVYKCVVFAGMWSDVNDNARFELPVVAIILPR